MDVSYNREEELGGDVETKYLTSGKHKFAYCESIIPDAEQGIIIVHGLAEHKGRYFEFMEQLGRNGISAFAMDLRGHGESSGKRADAKSYRQLLADLNLFVQHVKKQNPRLKLFLFGHSMGGQISFVYSAMYKDVDGLIVSNPPLELPKQAMKRIPYRLFGFIRIGEKKESSQKIFDASSDDPLACRSFTLRIVGVIFRQGIKLVNKSFEKLDCPTLYLVGTEDALVSCEASKRSFERIASVNKTLLVFEGVKHRIVQTDGSSERIDKIIKWIKSVTQL